MEVPFRLMLAFALQAASAAPSLPAPESPARFEVTFSPDVSAGPVSGRLLVIVSKNAQPEPRLSISPQGPAIFGLDLDQLEPDEPAIVDDSCVGCPWPLSALPAGEYHVQALIHVYQEVRRADGHTLWVHMNDGSQETAGVAPGNLFSDVQRLRVGAGTLRLEVSHVIPPAPPVVDTEWVKHVAIQSGKLSEFWGRPVSIHATVLLPRGYAEHPDVHYPAIYTLGHNVPFSLSTVPPSGDRAGSGRAAGGGLHPTTGLESGWDFFQAWLSDGFPRVIAVSFEQQTPFFPDSYSVNSPNNGPCGDAIVEEVLPALEDRFRILAKPYARHVEGASTGGWQTLALQLQHPDFFGGAWVLQPDPINFRSYQMVDIYRDRNAFELPAGQFNTVERPFRRTVEGQPVWSVRQLSRFEEVLGTHGRSGYQLEGWEAVFAPVGDDGYPRPLWNKLTGEIDREVAESMRERGYDLRDYAQRNWPTLGPKLQGKLHFFAGDMDDFYLNLAVYRFEEFLRGTTDPVSDAEFTYGRPKKGHSWHAFPWSEFVRRVAGTIRRNAPATEEPSAWNY